MINIPMAAIGYVRVSTSEQATDGASLDAQQAALRQAAESRSLSLSLSVDAGVSGKTLRRPALQDALARLDRGEAKFLLAVRLDRVSRSVADFAGLVDRASRKGWELVLLSPAIDTTDAAGRFTANVLASAAQYERELIGLRTREGMAQRRAEGVRMGRPSAIGVETYRRAAGLRADGLTYRSIAERFQEECEHTATGARWHGGTIRSMLLSTRARELGIEVPR